MITRRAQSRFRSERGATTLLTLGLAVVLLGLGGLGIDLWRVIAERHAIVSVADSMAAAAAGAVDTDAARNQGVLVLDDAQARANADAALAHATLPRSMTTAVVADVTADTVVVTATGSVRLTFLGLITPDDVSAIPIAVEVHARGNPAALDL